MLRKLLHGGRKSNAKSTGKLLYQRNTVPQQVRRTPAKLTTRPTNCRPWQCRQLFANWSFRECSFNKNVSTTRHGNGNPIPNRIPRKRVAAALRALQNLRISPFCTLVVPDANRPEQKQNDLWAQTCWIREFSSLLSTFPNLRHGGFSDIGIFVTCQRADQSSNLKTRKWLNTNQIRARAKCARKEHQRFRKPAQWIRLKLVLGLQMFATQSKQPSKREKWIHFYLVSHWYKKVVLSICVSKCNEQTFQYVERKQANHCVVIENTHDPCSNNRHHGVEHKSSGGNNLSPNFADRWCVMFLHDLTAPFRFRKQLICSLFT